MRNWFSAYEAMESLQKLGPASSVIPARLSPGCKPARFIAGLALPNLIIKSNSDYDVRDAVRRPVPSPEVIDSVTTSVQIQSAEVLIDD